MILAIWGKVRRASCWLGVLLASFPGLGQEARGERVTLEEVGAFAHGPMGDVVGLDVVGARAYLVSATGLWIVDVSDGARPGLVSWFPTPGARAVGVRDGTAYLALGGDGVGGNATMLMVDVSGARPTAKGEFRRYAGLMEGVDVSVAGGRTLLVAGGSGGKWNPGVRAFNLFDIDELATLAVRPGGVGAEAREGISGHMVEEGGEHVSAVVTEGGLTLVGGAGPEGSMRHVELGSKGGDVFLTRLGVDLAVLVAFPGLREVGIYVAPGGVGDLTPERRGGFATAGAPLGLWAGGGYCFVAAGSGGVEGYRLGAGGREAERVGDKRTGGRAVGLEVVGEWVYVADGFGGLKVMRWATDAEPSQGPEVRLEASAAEAGYWESVVLRAEVEARGVGVERVEFFDGEMKLGEDMEAPYEWEMKGGEVGPRMIRARATDGRGRMGESGPVRVAVHYGPHGGGQILFNNRVSGAVDARVEYALDPSQGASGFFFAELWAGRSQLGMQPIAATTFRTNSQAAYGYVNSVVATHPSLRGGRSVRVEMRVYLRSSATLAGSLQNSKIITGQSAAIQVVLTEPPEAPANLIGLQPTTVILPLWSFFQKMTIDERVVLEGDPLDIRVEAFNHYFGDASQALEKIEIFDQDVLVGEMLRGANKTDFTLRIPSLSLGTLYFNTLATGADGYKERGYRHMFSLGLPVRVESVDAAPVVRLRGPLRGPMAPGQPIRPRVEVESGHKELVEAKIRLFDPSGVERVVREYAEWPRGTNNACVWGIEAGAPLGNWTATFEGRTPAGTLGKSEAFPFMVTNALPLEQALGVQQLGVRSEGISPWVGKRPGVNEVVVAAESGFVEDGGRSEMSMEVVGPGRLSFSWAVSSEQGRDFLEFRVSGARVDMISGEESLHPVVYEVPAGPQVLSWVYAKDAANSAGKDAGWVGNVAYGAANQAPELMSVPNKVLARGMLWRHQLAGSDAETPAGMLVYSKVSGPAGLTVAAGGLLSWKPGPGDALGEHVARVRVSDGALSAEREFKVVVAAVNLPPSVTLSAPVGPVVAGRGVTLEAVATDPEGGVAKVEFYRQLELLGISTAAPHQLRLENLMVGREHLTARVTDMEGAVGVSGEVILEVVAPEGAARLRMDGAGRLRVAGSAGRSYQIQWKGKLGEAEWKSLGVVGVGTGEVEFEDGANPMGESRYYRAVLVE